MNYIAIFVVTTCCNLGDRSEHYNMNIHRHDTLKSLPTKQSVLGSSQSPALWKHNTGDVQTRKQARAHARTRSIF